MPFFTLFSTFVYCRGCGIVRFSHDLTEKESSPIILVPVGNLGYDDDCWGFLGNTLEEVLSKTTNPEEEFDKLYPEKELSENELRYIQLHAELKELEENKIQNKLDLKRICSRKNE